MTLVVVNTKEKIMSFISQLNQISLVLYFPSEEEDAGWNPTKELETDCSPCVQIVLNQF